MSNGSRKIQVPSNCANNQSGEAYTRTQHAGREDEDEDGEGPHKLLKWTNGMNGMNGTKWRRIEKRVRSKRVKVKFKEWQSGKERMITWKWRKWIGASNEIVVDWFLVAPRLRGCIRDIKQRTQKPESGEHAPRKFYDFFILISLPFDIMGNIVIRFMSSPISVHTKLSLEQIAYLSARITGTATDTTWSWR